MDKPFIVNGIAIGNSFLFLERKMKLDVELVVNVIAPLVATSLILTIFVYQMFRRRHRKMWKTCSEIIFNWEVVGFSWLFISVLIVLYIAISFTTALQRMCFFFGIL